MTLTPRIKEIMKNSIKDPEWKKEMEEKLAKGNKDSEERPIKRKFNPKSIPTLIIFLLMIWYMSSCKSAKHCNKYQWYGEIKQEQGSETLQQRDNIEGRYYGE